MSSTPFNNILPDEIIDLIFSHVPNEKLVDLVNIPSLQQHAMRKIYNTIHIGHRRHLMSDDATFEATCFALEYTIADYTPRFETLVECFSFFDRFPNVSPKHIRFQFILDLVSMYVLRPDWLVGKKIDLVIETNSKSYGLLLDTIPVEDLVDLVFHVEFSTKVKVFDDGFVNWLLRINPSSIDIWSVHLKEVFDGKSFSNLRCLHIDEDISVQETQLIPERICGLKCTLRMDDEGKELGFPVSLKRLTLSVLFHKAYPVDLSNLVNLSYLHIYSYPLNKTKKEWKLPINLKSLESCDSISDPGILKTECPKLKHLIYRDNHCSFTSTDWKLFPSSLVKLELTIETEIVKFGMPETEPKKEGYLYVPRILSTLKLQGDSTLPVKLDFLDNQLPNLKILELFSFTSLEFVNGYPVNLTTLTLCNVGTFNLQQLIKFKHLRKLELAGFTNEREFKHKLPSKLRFLSFERCSFDIITINNCNIEFLSLINIENDFTLDIPINLQKLYIDKSSTNKFLTREKHLPKSLNTLILTSSRILQVPQLQTSHLCTLDLLFNSMEEIDLKYLPESIVCLRMAWNRLHWINGDFGRLKHLKTVDLKCNLLNSWCRSLDKQSILFGDSIEIIDLSFNYITPDDCQGLIDVLFTYPSFIGLKIEPKAVPAKYNNMYVNGCVYKYDMKKS
ncbi:hypothetical protein G210_2758 [Candida maltosa Xu316]|uniref:Uncharacterized protein n=1 Tax=Candida maltosa (strain Xu316) TaxID=1245528 RepID=M3IKQ6_CANMX|nr:hypothetical protein G210_2758 [Candida maltosa Xu316]